MNKFIIKLGLVLMYTVTLFGQSENDEIIITGKYVIPNGQVQKMRWTMPFMLTFFIGSRDITI